MSVADALAVVAATVLAVWLVGSALVGGHDVAARIVAGALGIAAVGWVGMLVSTLGFAVFGHRTGLRVATLVALVVLLAVRRPRLLPPRPTAGALAAFAAAALVIWPSVSAPSNLIRGVDSVWHDGWTHQLMGGATSPTGPYPGIPNAYPWLFHALAAWFAQILPGGPLGGFLAIQVLAVLALGAGTWLLAAELGLAGPAVAWSSVLVIGSAGVGWIWRHEPTALLKLKYGLSAYHGDFVLPNAMSTGLGNLAPLLPREASLALVPAILWLAVRAARTASPLLAVLAGAVAGMGLILGPVEAILALAAVAAVAVAKRAPLLLLAFPAALAAAAVWLVPLALSYHRHGGLRETTTQFAPDPTLGQAAVALGVLLPLAAAGLVLLARRRELHAELIAITAVPLVACAGGLVVGSNHVVFGSAAFAHWIRYLPVLAVALVVPAGYAAAAAVAALDRVMRPLAVVAAAAVATAAIASTGLAAAAIRDYPVDPGLACSRTAPLGPNETVAVLAHRTWMPGDIGFWLFGRTGTRLVWLPRRLARVHFPRLPTGVPTEAARRGALRAMLAGGPPPPGVTWVVTTLARSSLSPRLEPYARCVWRGVYPLDMYRVVGR